MPDTPERPSTIEEQSETHRAPVHSLEARERASAQRRGASRERERRFGRENLRGTYSGVARASVAARAFGALADNVRDFAVFLINPHGIITFWGEGARLMKGWSKEEAEGAHLRLLYPDNGSEDGDAAAHLASAARDGEYSGEGHRARRDGSLFWAGVTLTALRDKRGVLLGFGKATRDLTAKRAADDLLLSAAHAAERARAAAVAADELKSGFLATMSHEIRTPINAILGYHQLLELEIDGALSEQQHRHLRRATASGRHLLSLITDVLDFSRLDSGQAGVRNSTFAIGDAVRGAIELVAPTAAENGLDLRSEASGIALTQNVAGDESSVRQILVNLLTNAVRYSVPGARVGTSPSSERAAAHLPDRATDASPERATDSSPDPVGMDAAVNAVPASTAALTPDIAVSVGMAATTPDGLVLSGRGPWIHVRVEDHGVGIAPAQIDAIFHPFVQGDMSLTRTPGGTGLGLSISRRLAHLMGGDITVESEVDKGSAFVLWLPAAPDDVVQEVARLLQPTDGENAQLSEPGGDTAQDMHAISEAILLDIPRILHAFVARIRSDPAVPDARLETEAQVQDHLGTFLVDLASTLSAFDPTSPEERAEQEDGAQIQREIAARHGMQRARLGWTAAEIEREFVVLREELFAALDRRLPMLSGTHHGELPPLTRARHLLEQFLSSAERESLAAHARERSLR